MANRLANLAVSLRWESQQIADTADKLEAIARQIQIAVRDWKAPEDAPEVIG